jgi:hypothetical protein
MATSAQLLADAFGRIREDVAGILDGLTPEQALCRLDPGANPVSWLVWHLTRVQDAQVTGAFGLPQEWTAGGWAARFGLPETVMDTGYGHSSADVARFAAATSDAALLDEYSAAVSFQTATLVSAVTDADLDRVIDTRSTTLAGRLMMVLDGETQHVGQAAYVLGCAQAL